MIKTIKRLVWHFIVVVLSAFIFAEVISRNIYKPLFWLAEYINSYDVYYELINKFDHSPVTLWTVLFYGWISSYFIFSLYVCKTSRLLSYLRYAPIVSFIFFLANIFAYDNLMIKYSQQQLRDYIRNSSYVYQYPITQLNLYNNYRGGCGNAAVGYYIWLYGETAIGEFNNVNPEVRLRALQTSIDLYAWEGNCEKPFISLLEKASQDNSLSVRTLAQSYIATSSSDCIKKQ